MCLVTDAVTHALSLRRFVVWQVMREEEFSPLKNADGASQDTPSTARAHLYALHRSFILRAGGLIASRSRGSVSGTQEGDARGEVTCEISPLVTYDGEGLEAIVKGRLLSPPILLCADREHRHSHSTAAGVCGGTSSCCP